MVISRRRGNAQVALPPKPPIASAMVRKHAGVAGKVLDHAFAFAFRGLVYAQIWEDPEIDIEALAIRPDSRMVAIASGGCNVLSYLVADPAAITAVDLNTAHVALAKLKLASARYLPDYAHFRRFFAEADRPSNIAAYHAYVVPYLDEPTRRYWEGRDLTLRRRIGGFRKGIYKRGLLGGFIGMAHLLARLYRISAQSCPPRRRPRSATCSKRNWRRCSTANSSAG
jgi:S-adenosylmethionine-diacylglycerol 3-amino-3-carboxypropyl transferase